MKKTLIVIYILMIMVACKREEPSMAPSRPPQIEFDPNIESFEGVPGDELRLGVKIEGESGFTLLVLEKIKNNKIISTAGKYPGRKMPFPHTWQESPLCRRLWSL
jgi:hypothetical protein